MKIEVIRINFAFSERNFEPEDQIQSYLKDEVMDRVSKALCIFFFFSSSAPLDIINKGFPY